MQERRSFRKHFAFLIHCMRKLKTSCTKNASRVMLSGMSSDARMKALRYYARAGRNMAEEVITLLQNPQAVFLFTPDLVVMMKPADSTAPHRWERLAENPIGADAWYIHLLAGNLRLARKLARLLPDYEWCCFQRGMRSAAPHRCRWARMRH